MKGAEEEPKVPVLDKSPPLSEDQSFCLYTFLCLREEKQGILALMKILGTYPSVEIALKDYQRLTATNIGCPIKVGQTGIWNAIRKPETDTQGEPIFVELPKPGETFPGESDTDAKNTEKFGIAEQASIQGYKDQLAAKKRDEKMNAVRKAAIEEMDTEADDPNSLASYARLRWKLLAVLGNIKELEEKLAEAKKAKRKMVLEQRARDAKHPNYKKEWKGEVERQQSVYGLKKDETLTHDDLTEDITSKEEAD